MTPCKPLYCEFIDTERLNAALRPWRAEAMPAGALALLPEAERESFPVLRQACLDAGLAFVGAIFPAIVEGMAFRTRGVMLLPFEPMPDTALIPSLSGDASLAAAEIADAVEARIEGAAVTLFMIFDAMVPNIGSILDALYLRLADRVAYVGVNAGSETFQPMPCLFDDRRVAANGVLCLLLPGAQGAALDHGYLAPKEIITATATQGNRIISIDWRPAFEVYQEQVRSLYEIDLTAENFYQYAIHFPFGILLANNELIVRIPVALESDGSLFCVGEVPANAMLTLLRAPQVDSAHSVARIAAQLERKFTGMGEHDLLTFYCAGRRLHLGADAVEELGHLQRATHAPRLVGALSLGEIGSLSEWGYPLFHNATLVCRPW